MSLRYKVGLRIRDLRRASGLTQGNLAKRINKSTQTIGQIERGVFAPSLDTIEAISRALNAPPALLLPPTASAKKPTAKDELLSSIVSHAARLTKDDMELLKLISVALFERRRSA